MMLNHYLRTALRHLWRQKLYSLINIMGLAIGLAACMLCWLAVQDGVQEDHFHLHKYQIYRVVSETLEATTGTWRRSMSSPYRLAVALHQAFPDISYVVRLAQRRVVVQPPGGPPRSLLFSFTDPDVFEVFTFPLRSGDPRTALRSPLSLVLTEAMAQQVFGEAHPIGKTLVIQAPEFGRLLPDGNRLNASDSLTFTVTGILEPVPEQSELSFDILATIPGAAAIFPTFLRQSWDAKVTLTYVLLPPHVSPESIERRLPDFVQKTMGAELASRTRFLLESILANEPWVTDRQEAQVYIMIGGLLLLMACVNFINLAMARSSIRAREVALRKAMGASRMELFRQHLGESICVAALAIIPATMLAELITSLLIQQLGRDAATFAVVEQLPLLGLSFAITVVVGGLSGLYPACFLSALEPAAVLRGWVSGGVHSIRIRKLLVIAQYTVATLLIIAALMIHHQLVYLQAANMRNTLNQVWVMPQAQGIFQRYDALKDAFLTHPQVMAITLASNYPLSGFDMGFATRPEGKSASNELPMQTYWIYHDFFKTLGIPIVNGRVFSPDDDFRGGFIINEAAARLLTWRQPIGKRLAAQYIQNGQLEWTPEAPIIGVAQDVPFKSLHQAIQPAVFFLQPNLTQYVLIRLHPGPHASVQSFLERAWREVYPQRPFFLFALQQEFSGVYKVERRQRLALGIAGVFALIIAGLGLFGLTAFVAEQRTKEIGIRKALGASVTTIVIWLSRDMTILVLTAMFVAWPLAYCAMRIWLRQFTSHIDISSVPFLVGGGLALLIAWATVGYQAIKAARIQPVGALRHE